MNSKDEIFKNNELNGKFRFNSRVAEVFDDMLSRSVPLYSHVILMSAQILKTFLHNDDTVYDLGCSPGTTLLELSRSLADLDIKYVAALTTRLQCSKKPASRWTSIIKAV